MGRSVRVHQHHQPQSVSSYFLCIFTLHVSPNPKPMYFPASSSVENAVKRNFCSKSCKVGKDENLKLCETGKEAQLEFYFSIMPKCAAGGNSAEPDWGEPMYYFADYVRPGQTIVATFNKQATLALAKKQGYFQLNVFPDRAHITRVFASSGRRMVNTPVSLMYRFAACGKKVTLDNEAPRTTDNSHWVRGFPAWMSCSGCKLKQVLVLRG